MISYLLGSVPFGVWVTKAMSLGDLRQVGSGNIGATNVLRTGNKTAAAITLLLDGGKGALAVRVAYVLWGEDAAECAALFSFLGHLFPIWAGFKGGKGVATFLGIFLALSWPVGIMVCVSWFITAMVSKISSLSALVATVSAPIFLFLLGYDNMIFLSIVLVVLVFWRHHQNIVRLFNGTEPRIGKK